MSSRWQHLVQVYNEKVGRNWHSTIKGFADRAEVEEYEQYYQDNCYAYFPRTLKVWEDTGVWYITISVADSCD
jgi:hypothetical protein